jgi:hypothetical protein
MSMACQGEGVASSVSWFRESKTDGKNSNIFEVTPEIRRCPSPHSLQSLHAAEIFAVVI